MNGQQLKVVMSSQETYFGRSTEIGAPRFYAEVWRLDFAKPLNDRQQRPYRYYGDMADSMYVRFYT